MKNFFFTTVNLVLIFSFFLFVSCKTVSKKVDKAVLEEEKKLTMFLNKPVNELKIELGEPDLVEINSNKNKDYVYYKSKNLTNSKLLSFSSLSLCIALALLKSL